MGRKRGLIMIWSSHGNTGAHRGEAKGPWPPPSAKRGRPKYHLASPMKEISSKILSYFRCQTPEIFLCAFGASYFSCFKAYFKSF